MTPPARDDDMIAKRGATMKPAKTSTAGRGGFTLIELLVVMGIIAVLLGLLIPGVMKVLGKGPELNTTNDISQLGNALGAFKTKFGKYPPSRIRLFAQMSSYNPTFKIDRDSSQFLKGMFPRIANGGPVNWGVPDGTILEGSQCLVFFLGGVQTNSGGVNGCLGFSSDDQNPMALGGTRIGPFFDFKNNRLVGAPGQFVYNDYYGQPYLYFNSGHSREDYNRYWNDPYPGTGTPMRSDCSQMGNGAYYMSNSPVMRYHNPDSFQIISAGADKAFGQGGQWTPGNASAIGPGGLDDLTNFSGGRLGSR
jgi:prepilin-type N-terminal cleavage/methylation domain-containing protein